MLNTLTRKFAPYAAAGIMALAGGTGCAAGLQGATVAHATAESLPEVKSATFKDEVFNSRGFVLAGFVDARGPDMTSALQGVAAAQHGKAHAHDKIKVVTINAADPANADVLVAYDVVASPVAVLFKDGRAIARQEGLTDAAGVRDWAEQSVAQAKKMQKTGSLLDAMNAYNNGATIANDETIIPAVRRPGLVLVDICQDGIPACDAIDADALARRFAGDIKVVKMNVDESLNTAKSFDLVDEAKGTVRLPGMFLFNDGKAIARVPVYDQWWHTARALERVLDVRDAVTPAPKAPAASGRIIQVEAPLAKSAPTLAMK